MRSLGCVCGVLQSVGYGETGKFIAALHPSTQTDECQNDPIVQRYDEAVFGSQVSVSWRGASTATGHRLVAEYLQICYFGLYAVVVGVPLTQFALAYVKRSERATIERDAKRRAATASAAAAASGEAKQMDGSGSAPASAPASAAAHSTPQRVPHPSSASASAALLSPARTIDSASASLSFASPPPAPTATATTTTPHPPAQPQPPFTPASNHHLTLNASGSMDALTRTSSDTLITVVSAAASASGSALPPPPHLQAAYASPSTASASAVASDPNVSLQVLVSGEERSGEEEADAEADADAEAEALGAGLVVDEEQRFDAAMVTLLVVSYVCWVVYLFFPVAGPFWCFQRSVASSITHTHTALPSPPHQLVTTQYISYPILSFHLTSPHLIS